MTYEGSNNGPIVIGGVGGSGTRVVAEILALFGFYIGCDLNEASDNLWYTLLFKRPRWFYKNRTNNNEIKIGLSLYHKLMTSRERLSLGEYRFLSQAVVEMALSGHNHHGNGKGLWPFGRIRKMISPVGVGERDYVGWGWKEPNSHLLISNLADYFFNFKYIHLIRHGLDMAFSHNQQQLYNWGRLFDVELPNDKSEIPSASFSYWVRANDTVIDIGEKLGDSRFLLINYDKLCDSPINEINKITKFIGILVDDQLISTACNLVRKPKTAQRYKKHDVRQFNCKDVSALERFGFII
ncbi:MAG TPA: sulfotransferase [Nitrospirota bacterium]|nr:sulfotransferase [Nitrospirota bacterium]